MKYKYFITNCVYLKQLFLQHVKNLLKMIQKIMKSEISSTGNDPEDDRKSILFITRDITEYKHLKKEAHNISENVPHQVGQYLHDDLGPHLIGIESLTTALKYKLEQKSAPEAADLEKIRMLIHRAIMKTQMLMRGLCPVDLDSRGLITALTKLASLTSTIFKMECRFEYDQSITVMDNMLATNLYYITKEAVHNACRHSGAEHVLITLGYKNNNFIIEVADDGNGIKTSARKKPGMGLRIIQYRADLINGFIKLRKNKPKGTVVICTVPDIHNQKEKIYESAQCV